MTLSRNRRLILTLVAMSVLFAAFAVAAPGPFVGVAQAANCKLDFNKYPRYPESRGKGGYFTKLDVTGTSCTDGKRQMLAWYKCRIENGGLKGKCTASKVRGYRCTENRGSIQVGAGRSEFSARVTCRNGSKKIVHSYDQFV